jgi:transcriptional regulator with XRE-family HTH domain
VESSIPPENIEQAIELVESRRAALKEAEAWLAGLLEQTLQLAAEARGRELVAELVRRRDELGLTTYQLAKRQGCTVDNLQRREEGKMWPTQAIFSQWATALGAQLEVVDQATGERQRLKHEPSEVAAQLVALRQAKSLTQVAVAARLQTSPQVLARRESGAAAARGQYLPVLLEWLHVLGYELEVVDQAKEGDDGKAQEGAAG